jgi:hypothetical protein
MKDQVHFFRDAGIARCRAVVERTICAVKKWRILRNKSFLTKIDVWKLNELLLVICALTNYQLQCHGGRGLVVEYISQSFSHVHPMESGLGILF